MRALARTSAPARCARLRANAVWARLETAQRLQHLVAVGFQRVHPEIDRRAPRERRPLLGRAGAEGALEFAREPLRIIAAELPPAHRRGDRARRPASSASDSGSGAWRPPSARAATSSGRHAPARDQGAQHQRAGACLTHGIGARRRACAGNRTPDCRSPPGRPSPRSGARPPNPSSASEAGRLRASISARTSIAALARADGVISSR